MSAVPRQVGRFKLLRELGSTVGTWLHEARAVSRISHPHIVPVFEADEAREAGGRPYLVFEYVKGPTLAAHLRARRRLAAARRDDPDARRARRPARRA
jgi:serine/threonine protein kinase